MNKILPIIFCMVLINACSDTEKDDIKYTDDYSVINKIEYGLSIKNNTGRDLKNAKVLIYAPVEKSSSQKIVKLNINQSHKVFKDAVGNQIISISYENAVPGLEDEIKIQAELQMATDPNLIREASVATFKNINRDVLAEQKEMIDSVVQTLKAESSVEKLQEITNWAENNLSVLTEEQLMADFQTNAEINQAVDIGMVSIAKKEASARGKANILLDMVKTAGITVRWVVGISANEKNRVELADAKLWLQFMDSGKWRLFDRNSKKEIEDYSTKVLLRIFPDYIDREFNNPEQLVYETIGVEKQVKR